ncbi:MAG: hypothetical protein ACKOAR_09055, partial [Bacteroidota bacterium]
QTPVSTGECKIDNNLYAVKVIPRPLTVEAVKLSDNRVCSPTDPSIGAAQATVKQGGVTVTDLSGYNFKWYANGTGTDPAIAGQTAYNLVNVPAGTYSVIAEDKVLGCKSGVASVTIVDDVLTTSVSITASGNQTKCSPPDGFLEATVLGGNSGYTFRWIYVDDFSILPETGSSVSGLESGQYQVQAIKTGCPAISSIPLIITGPSLPTATAVGSVIQNCNNPNAGTLSGAAELNDVPQSSGFTYNWYLSNNGVRGSILPPANGSGPNRTGLGVGFYELEVTDNNTQCKATQIDVITSSPTVLDVVVTEVRPQTSCDPATPNGKLKAVVTVGGAPVNLADYNIEWFEGDNTSPPVKATTQTITGVKSGTFYTARATEKNTECANTGKRIITDILPVPSMDMTTGPNSVCTSSLAFTGTTDASVAFNGTADVTDFSHFSFTWDKGNGVDPAQKISFPNTDNITNPSKDKLAGLASGFYTATVVNDTSKCA